MTGASRKIQSADNRPEVREAKPPAHLTPQGDHLMSQRDILSLKLAFGFYWQSEKG
jgi:hypothetical protein